MKKALLLITAFLLFLPFINGNGGVAHAQGNFAWAKQIGSTNYDQVTCVRIDAAGDVYTMGSFYTTTDFDPGSGVFNLTPAGGMYDNDIYICKLDAAGNFLWARQLGGTSYDSPGSMAVDAAGNVYTIGSFEGSADFDPGAGIFTLTTTGDYDQDAFISKLDASGNFVWAKQFKGLGLYHYNQGTAIAIDPSGNVYTTGEFGTETDFDPGVGEVTLTPLDGSYQNVFISKLDAEGNFGWAEQLSAVDYGSVYVNSIAVDKSGNVITAGSLQGTADFDPGSGTHNLTANPGMWGYNQNIYISKLNTSGNYVWAKLLGGENYSYVSDLAVDTAENVYTTGSYQGITDFNPGTGVYNLTPVGGTYDQDIFVSKIDAAGNFGWARSMGGTGYDNSNGIIADVASNVYTIGNFQDSADFNPRSGVYNLTAVGMYSQDIFVSKLDDAGSFIWAKRIGGTSDYSYNQGASIAVDATANTYLTGTFQNTTDFDPGAGVFNITTFGGSYDQDVFVVKLHDTLSTVNVAEHLGHGVNDFRVYPNPSNGTFNLGMNLESDSKLTIEIVDITGQLIKTVNQTKLNAGVNSIAFDESELPNGIYFVKVYNETINKTLKFLINK